MYSAPEIISEEGKRSRPADIFSLGCVFSEMATLLDKRSVAEFVQYRVKGNTHAYHATLDKVAEWLKGSACFDNFIRQMFSVSPKKRPSAAEVRHIVSREGIGGIVGLNCQHNLTRSILEPQGLAGVFNDISACDINSQASMPELAHLDSSVNDIYNIDTTQPDKSSARQIPGILPVMEAPPLSARRLLEEVVNVHVDDRLHQAARCGDVVLVRLLLGEGADVAAKDSDEWTALRKAAESGHETVVRLLLVEGADVAAKDNIGRMVLHRTAEKGLEAVVRLLLEKGVDVAATDINERTALHWAAENGQEAMVRLLTIHEDNKKDKEVLKKRRNGELDQTTMTMNIGSKSEEEW
jgi:hypothetical protein